jgi:acetolactate synthase I/II/III large subunit
MPTSDFAVQSISDSLGAERGNAELELTGAEAVAIILQQHGTEIVFAYAGTSELALCRSVDRAAQLRLVNGRGDKECVFMAAGASLFSPNKGVAIVHGARGLTNAAGAIADARRNETGTLIVVGLASTGSTRFLPPHAENDLITSIGNFTEWHWEVPAIPDDAPGRRRAAHSFVTMLRTALSNSARPPTRPSMFGIPQDVANTRWIPQVALRAPWRPPDAPAITASSVTKAADMMGQASRPLVLLDDYALAYPQLRETLAELTKLIGAPVFQLRYRRGPMLFERLRKEEVGNFLGWLNPFSAAHKDLLEKCDLFITVEDRNIYRRVVGDLPYCRKIAITSDRSKVLKNEYLENNDILIEGNVISALKSLTSELTRRGVASPPWYATPVPGAADATPEPACDAVEYMRTAIVGAIAKVLGGWHAPVLVDDSQMFGGLLAERYELLPPGLRIFGGHGGFVGGGLATAVGLAISHPQLRVLCTLGDQGFTNSFQGLVSAVQDQVPVVILVCNNGGAVSLQKQAAVSEPDWNGTQRLQYLGNVPGFSYQRVAEALGAAAWLVEMRPDPDSDALGRAADELGQALTHAAAAGRPALVELRLPADPDVWKGIWLTQGFDENNSASSRSLPSLK